MITLSYWMVAVSGVLTFLAGWYCFHLGHRHGYHQGYWAAIIKERKR